MELTGGYKDLVAWQKSMDLVVAVYAASARFPSDERFGLTAQVRRAAVSIPSNIAEGYSRRTRPEYVRFLDIARGSANEVETQMIIAVRLGFPLPGDSQGILESVQEVQRILKGLVGSLRSEKQDHDSVPQSE
jgi:four helix bundle protein